MAAIPTFSPNAVIPKWARIAIRTVGTINAALALLGASFIVDSTHSFLTDHAGDPRISYFRVAATPCFRLAFIAMSLINVAFLAILSVTAIRFIQVRVSSINSYSYAVLMLAIYGYTIGVLWHAGRGIGISIAAATGIGNMGVAPFEACFVIPYLYPVMSIVLLQILKRRYNPQPTLANATQ